MNMKLLLESWKAHTQELLTEKKMEQVEIRFQSKNFLKAVNQFNEEAEENEGRFAVSALGRYKPKSPQYIQEKFTNQIPNDIKEKDKAEALDWMITSFINTGDIDFYSKDIELFYQIKEAKQDRILSKNSIYSIKDSIELHEIVEAAKPAWEAYNESRADKDSEAGSNKIYEDEGWTVYVPENKGAACKLGKGTEWCTAAPGLEYYRAYHKEDDPLIIFISKQNPSEKYQFSYGSSQFMDPRDEDIRNNKTLLWYELNYIVANMESPRIPDKIKDMAAQYSEGFEKLPNGGYRKVSEYTTSYFDKNGALHREDGPAFIERDNKMVFIEVWYTHGKKDRKDGPAQIEYTNGDLYRESWYANGSLGRKDGGPTVVEYDESGKVFLEQWLNSYGLPDRKDGPAIVRADGVKIWYIDGYKHRLDGPAYESPKGDKYFWLDSEVSKEQYEERKKSSEEVPFEESLKRMIKEEIVRVLKEGRKLGKPSSETSLRDWFKRKGAPGKKGGWVDCNTCRDGKCKPCGRQEGESRSKYPRCRPTPSQCKGYKRRGSNLQKEE